MTRIYTIHTRAWSAAADGDAVLVKEGFSWPAFFFGLLWALWHGMWRTAIALLLVDLAVTAGVGLARVDEAGASAVSLAVHALVGLWGNDIRRRALVRGGYDERGAVAGRGREEAEQRALLDAAPRGSGA